MSRHVCCHGGTAGVETHCKDCEAIAAIISMLHPSRITGVSQTLPHESLMGVIDTCDADAIVAHLRSPAIADSAVRTTAALLRVAELAACQPDGDSLGTQLLSIVCDADDTCAMKHYVYQRISRADRADLPDVLPVDVVIGCLESVKENGSPCDALRIGEAAMCETVFACMCAVGHLRFASFILDKAERDRSALLEIALHNCAPVLLMKYPEETWPIPRSPVAVAALALLMQPDGFFLYRLLPTSVASHLTRHAGASGVPRDRVALLRLVAQTIQENPDVLP